VIPRYADGVKPQLIIIITCVLASGCKQLEEPPPPPFNVAVTVQADQGVPLPGVIIQRNNKEIGKTTPDGKAVLTFRGEEGDQIDVWVKCPDGFDSPTKPTTVALRRLADPNKLAEYPVRCPPAERKVVVAVRSDNGANLPVKYLNREIARTDPSGAATFMLNGKPGDHMEFTLDTSEKANENLRPQNPTMSLVVDNKDNFYSLDQPFQVQRARIVVVAPHRPQPIGPTPLRY
jgi:hypothetical protein